MNTNGVPVELYKNDGSVGAALGAGIGVKAFASAEDAFTNLKPLKVIEPQNKAAYESAYADWKELLDKQLINNKQEEIICQSY
ncbi:hypothetical protein D3C78_1832440 [compost metagenome]